MLSRCTRTKSGLSACKNAPGISHVAMLCLLCAKIVHSIKIAEVTVGVLNLVDSHDYEDITKVMNSDVCCCVASAT